MGCRVSMSGRREACRASIRAGGGGAGGGGVKHQSEREGAGGGVKRQSEREGGGVKRQSGREGAGGKASIRAGVCVCVWVQASIWAGWGWGC